VLGHAHDLGPTHFGADDGAEVRVGSEEKIKGLEPSKNKNKQMNARTPRA
jgi:hypothetical protein